MGIYFAVIIGLLVYSDFLPYVTDNNESFSALFHARNILRFGLSSTAGLTDEASSGAPAAHPYVYTHGGNFPRIPVLVLMLLGVNAVEQQITILALLVGGVSLYLCYRFFSRIAGDLFAFLVVAVLSTDYLLFTQWQVNTFRVWHAFFFFVSLLCVQMINEDNKRIVGAILFVNALVLFYFELVFAIFTALCTGIYALTLHRRRPAVMVRTIAALALGSLLAMGTLLGQMIAHLGPERAIDDIRLTYLARNFGAAGPEAAAMSLSFFVRNHIVFWDNLFRPSGFMGLNSFIVAVSEGVVKVHTPYLALITWIMSLSLLLSWPAFHDRMARQEGSLTGKGSGVEAKAFEIPGSRLVLAATFVAIVIGYMLRSRIYETTTLSQWQGSIQDPLDARILQLVLTGSFLLGVYLVLTGGGRHLRDDLDKPLLGITRYFLAGGAALASTYLLSPGYFWTGYLSRYAPLPVFIADVWFALILYVFVTVALQSGRRALGALNRIRVGQEERGRGLSVLVFLASAIPLVFVTQYWVRLQGAYVSKLPPTSILFMKQLALPEFKGASFVSDNYPLPIAYFTGQWAYQDQMIPDHGSVSTVEGVRLISSGKYAWFADRETNGSYLRPEYYLCRINPDLGIAAALASLLQGGRLENCSGQPIVRAARFNGRHPFRHTLSAIDQTPANLWAIVKLDKTAQLIPYEVQVAGELAAKTAEANTSSSAPPPADFVAEFVGKTSVDIVGESATAEPNGKPDVAFRLTIRPRGGAAIKILSLSIMSSDSEGRFAGGGRWDTYSQGVRALGVTRDGKVINAGPKRLLEIDVTGRTVLDVYMQDGEMTTFWKYFTLRVDLAGRYEYLKILQLR